MTYLADRVKKFHDGIGERTPDSPTEMPEDLRWRRAIVCGEEYAEKIISLLGYANAQSLMLQLLSKVGHKRAKGPFGYGPGDLEEIVDACIDSHYVTAGTLLVAGVKDKDLIDLVCDNNDEKLANGTMGPDGKFVKHPDHKKPDIRGELIRQGWVP